MGKDNISCQMWEYLLSAWSVKIESEVAFLDGVESIYGRSLIWLIITKGFGKQHHVAARAPGGAFFFARQVHVNVNVCKCKIDFY